jgi:hypothetical protein
VGRQVRDHRRGPRPQRRLAVQQRRHDAGEHDRQEGQHERGRGARGGADRGRVGRGTFAGHNWGTVVTGGSSQTNNSGWPGADLAKAQYVADVDELGVMYDVWLVNPQEKMNFYITYGSAANDVLAANGIREMFASNRITAGTAYAVASQQVGELRVEKPLSTETWRQASVEATWSQSSCGRSCTSPTRTRSRK